MKNPVALITGVTGQDGARLAEYLLGRGYEVHGVVRRASSINTKRIDHLYVDPHEPDVRFFLHYGDLTDSTNLIRLVQEVRPDEIYNLGAQSHVQVSFETPEYTANSDALGTLRLLEAVRLLGREREVRFYQASTSELFGDAPPHFRQAEVDCLVGDAAKARKELGWRPKIGFAALVADMVRADLRRIDGGGSVPARHG